MRRSWLATPVETYTSPTRPPHAWNPPHVPALITMSGLRASIARKVLSAAGTVPTLSTPKSDDLPLQTMVTRMGPPGVSTDPECSTAGLRSKQSGLTCMRGASRTPIAAPAASMRHARPPSFGQARARLWAQSQDLHRRLGLRLHRYGAENGVAVKRAGRYLRRRSAKPSMEPRESPATNL